MKYIKKYGLYDNLTEIRVGLLTESGKIVEDNIFNDPKIRIVYIGEYEDYEKPTLLHMRKSADTDSSNYTATEDWITIVPIIV